MKIVTVLVASVFCCVRCCDIAATCVTDLTADDCPEGFYYIQNSTVFGCCPSCEIRAGLGDPCNDAVQCLPGLTCLANVLCVDSGATTEPEEEANTGPCESTSSDTSSSCLADGTYAPVQCKGDKFTGRCFCSDADGNRIFGQMWRSEADEMTCACSRQRTELEATRADVTLHCTPTGNYEPLQCDDGLCWCAQPATGQPTHSPVSQHDMHLLPCYSASAVGSQYLRRCESLVYALNVIRKEQTEHGTQFFGTPTATCDYDGSYGAFQVTNGQAYCTGRDGNILGAWQATVGTGTADMDCNCALDTMVHYPAHGVSVTQVCLSNGNYQPHQVSGDFHYCVDGDGYPTTAYLPLDTVLSC